MISSNPMLQNMVQSNPQMAAMLNDPAMLQMLANPNVINSALQMLSQGGGGMGGMGGLGGLGGMGGLGGFGGMFGGQNQGIIIPLMSLNIFKEVIQELQELLAPPEQLEPLVLPVIPALPRLLEPQELLVLLVPLARLVLRTPSAELEASTLWLCSMTPISCQTCKICSV